MQREIMMDNVLKEPLVLVGTVEIIVEKSVKK
jgi:hypothetical protein